MSPRSGAEAKQKHYLPLKVPFLLTHSMFHFLKTNIFEITNSFGRFLVQKLAKKKTPITLNDMKVYFLEAEGYSPNLPILFLQGLF
jgi:hypothetical protein